MNELYWIFVLGKLSTAFLVLWIIGLTIWLVMGIIYIGEYYDKEALWKNRLRRKMCIVAIITASIFFISCFTPNERQIMVIYGIGGTIDYLKDNIGVEKHLSDKTIKCLDLFIDKYTKEDESVGSKR